VYEQLKSNPNLVHVPVVSAPSHDAPALEADAIKLGAAGYITKPLVAA
jgi:two-component system, cell cycle response regulator